MKKKNKYDLIGISIWCIPIGSIYVRLHHNPNESQHWLVDVGGMFVQEAPFLGRNTMNSIPEINPVTGVPVNVTFNRPNPRSGIQAIQTFSRGMKIKRAIFPSGKCLQNYGKSPFFRGESTKNDHFPKANCKRLPEGTSEIMFMPNKFKGCTVLVSFWSSCCGTNAGKTISGDMYKLS